MTGMATNTMRNLYNSYRLSVKDNIDHIQCQSYRSVSLGRIYGTKTLNYHHRVYQKSENKYHLIECESMGMGHVTMCFEIHIYGWCFFFFGSERVFIQ